MSQVINTNVLSLNAQRNLSNNSASLAQSLQRLSSGLRINSAKDDAAGLAISERFTTQINGLNQAVRNANDGISLAQTGEAALQEVQNNLQRIRELAVQSVNATNSDSDRATLDQEVRQRLAEIGRTASQTSFNGRNVLDSSFGNAQFQVGANVGQTISLDLTASVRTRDIGAVATASSVDLNGLIAEGETAAGTQTEFTSAAITSANAIAFAPTVTTVSTGALGTYDPVIAAANTNATLQIMVGSVTAVDLTATGTSSTTPIAAADVGADIFSNLASLVAAEFSVVSVSGGGTVTDLSTATSATAITAAVSGGTLAFQREDGEAFTVTQTIGGTDVSGGGFNTTLSTDLEVATGIAPAANSVFTVTAPGGDERTITLTQDYTADTNGLIALAADIQAGAEGDFTVTVGGADNNQLVFTAAADPGDEAASFAFGSEPTFVTNGIETTEGVAGTAISAVTLTLEAGELTIQIGDATAVDITSPTGGFTTTQGFIDAVNTALAGNASVQVTGGTTTTPAVTLEITSGEDVTIGGAEATTVFTQETNTAQGSLDDVNVLTPGGSNEAIQRIDAALASVSDLRSTFGAIQNRFESVISSLSANSEALSASRSRIRDADFAAETAELTRVQILQQAGISVLAQANAAPQSVLALLQ